nr:Uncharacterised protein [Salmonella sp. NCTC 7297]
MPWNSLPAALTPIPTDNSQYVNYTRTWRWDDSGNLQSQVHAGGRKLYANDDNRGDIKPQRTNERQWSAGFR